METSLCQTTVPLLPQRCRKLRSSVTAARTAQYGALTRGRYVVDEHTKAQMRKVLAEIQDGTFAREWIAEYAAGNVHYKALKGADMQHPVEVAGRKLRSAMNWLGTESKAGQEAVA